MSLIKPLLVTTSSLPTLVGIARPNQDPDDANCVCDMMGVSFPHVVV